jgi:hypothetical protein
MGTGQINGVVEIDLMANKFIEIINFATLDVLEFISLLLK